MKHPCLTFFIAEYRKNNCKGWYDGDHILCELNGIFYDETGTKTLTPKFRRIEDIGYIEFILGFDLSAYSRHFIKIYYFENVKDRKIELELKDFSFEKSTIAEYFTNSDYIFELQNTEDGYIYMFYDKTQDWKDGFCTYSNDYYSIEGVLRSMLYPYLVGTLVDKETNEQLYTNNEAYRPKDKFLGFKSTFNFSKTFFKTVFNRFFKRSY